MRRAVLTLVTAVALSTGPLAIRGAQAQTTDHLQCYKIRDPHAFSGLLNLDSPQFGLTSRCKVRIRGTRLCVPTRKQVMAFDPETPVTDFESERLRFDRICYRVKCPDTALPVPEVTDQFGTRVVQMVKLTEICTPAVEGPAPSPVCGNAVLEPGEECESAIDCGGGAGCSPSCTCQCAFADPRCPDVLELTTLAGTGSEVTVTEEDWGFTGLAHDSDAVDRSRFDLRIACAGQGPAACGQCEVRGVDADARNCRCANDNRTACDQPFTADGDDCGGAQCECYIAPPTPRSNGNVPLCALTRLTDQPTGTWNVDTGVGAVDLELARRLYLGDTLLDPCPRCVGDAVANDGARDGICVGGAGNTMSCDANGTDATFPAPGGGAYSYDCLPVLGKLVGSPSGRKVDRLSLSTASSSLAAAVDCGLIPGLCHCGVCSGDAGEPCASDIECAAEGLGACGGATAASLSPNSCSGAVCSDVGGGEGACADGPTDLFCDGIMRANGEGIISCISNADCDPQNIGIDAGSCTLAKQRECFLPTIETQGTPSPSRPVLAGVACSAASTGSGVNATVGLPGALRIKLEAETSFRCAGNPAFTYPECP